MSNVEKNYKPDYSYGVLMVLMAILIFGGVILLNKFQNRDIDHACADQIIDKYGLREDNKMEGVEVVKIKASKSKGCWAEFAFFDTSSAGEKTYTSLALFNADQAYYEVWYSPSHCGYIKREYPRVKDCYQNKAAYKAHTEQILNK